jgi:UDP-N-acetyl-D-galactosamine dehydrogenase
MDTYQRIESRTDHSFQPITGPYEFPQNLAHNRNISVIGLGYVGLPVAAAFGKQRRVVGFDIDPARIAQLRLGWDRTNEVEAADLKDTNIRFSTRPEDLRAADFHIIAVPTPVAKSKSPDLEPVLRASEVLGKQLKKGDIVVYESTVYPGVTEEECIPVLEQSSGLICGVDFFVGYSPERINPGDKVHTFRTIKKVVSAQDPETLEIVAAVYASVVDAGVHRAPSIKVAEASKVIENTQRDLNISLMNELALIFHTMDIDTQDVLAAAGTKWNFLPFEPGLVGGHCIGVDPYYLTHKAQINGYKPRVILAGRNINDNIGPYVARKVLQKMIRGGCGVSGCRVTLLGMSFKENVPDLRNTRVIDIVRELQAYGVEVQVHDPLSDAAECRREYGIELLGDEQLLPADAVILTVPHWTYLERGWDWISTLLIDGKGLVADIKSRLAREEVPDGVQLWRL